MTCSLCQVKCFSSPLQPDELGSVLNTVHQKLPQGVVDNGLSLSGFLFLHALFMERGSFETTWAVLRTYGYTNELTLTDDLFRGINFEVTSDQVRSITNCFYLPHLFHFVLLPSPFIFLMKYNLPVLLLGSWCIKTTIP